MPARKRPSPKRPSQTRPPKKSPSKTSGGGRRRKQTIALQASGRGWLPWLLLLVAGACVAYAQLVWTPSPPKAASEAAVSEHFDDDERDALRNVIQKGGGRSR